MTTRAILRARILDDLERDQATWGTRIDQAIDDAIAHYQSKRFYFNESRTVTFNTVAGTDTYTFPKAATAGTITPDFYQVDVVYITVGGSVDELRRVDYDWLEQIADNNTAQGQPYNYAYVGQTWRIYPVPNAIYTIRILGHLKVATPATDAETDNPWMADGFELIRSRAKGQFAMHVIEDESLASRMAVMEKSALSALMGATYHKAGSGNIIPTQF